MALRLRSGSACVGSWHRVNFLLYADRRARAVAGPARGNAGGARVGRRAARPRREHEVLTVRTSNAHEVPTLTLA